MTAHPGACSTSSPLKFPSYILSIYATAHDQAWLTCEDGKLYHYDGSDWQEAIDLGFTISDMTALEDGTLLLLGGSCIYSLKDGELRLEYDSGTPLRAISALDANNIWACGVERDTERGLWLKGKIFYFDGTEWKLQLEEKYEDFIDILALDEDNIYAVSLPGASLYSAQRNEGGR